MKASSSALTSKTHSGLPAKIVLISAVRNRPSSFGSLMSRLMVSVIPPLRPAVTMPMLTPAPASSVVTIFTSGTSTPSASRSSR